MVKVEIREAQISDIASITEIYNHAILHTTAHYYIESKTIEDRTEWFHQHTPKHPIIVATVNEKIIGWASLTRWSVYHAFDETVECSVYLDEAHRGIGIGFQLLNELIIRAEKLQLKSIIARILDGNPASIAIHKKLGFEHRGTLKQIGKKFGNYIDLHLMQRML